MHGDYKKLVGSENYGQSNSFCEVKGKENRKKKSQEALSLVKEENLVKQEKHDEITVHYFGIYQCSRARL